MKVILQNTVLLFFTFFLSAELRASYLLIPMDDVSQENHLKAYGITFFSLQKSYHVRWLLNYRGGSFLLEDKPELRKECVIRGVSYEILSDTETLEIIEEIGSPSKNQEVVLLEKAPRIAVYSPKNNPPWTMP